MNDIITIELFGEKYSFQADADVSNANEVADLLTKEVASVEEQLSGNRLKMSKLSILALAALNILSDYETLKQDHANLLQKVTKRSASLSKMIDMTL